MSAHAKLTTLDRTIEAGTRRLLELQDTEGWWVGELESNATMVAEHLFWLHVLGLRDPATDRKLANDLLARRRDDGTWSNWWEGPPDLSTTIESYVALKMAGVDAGDETRAYIRREGGVRRRRVFTKCFLALLDAWPWQDIPTVPVELILLPPSAPLSVYNFGCWARQTVVPLSVVQALRPVRPAGVDLSEIGAQHGASSPPASPTSLRRRAIATAEQWVRERQEADGGWGGIQPPWVWSILMLAALGRDFDDPCLRRAVEGWSGFLVEDGRPVAAGGVPVAHLGHGPRSPRAPRLRRARRPPTARESRRMVARAGGDGRGGLGRAATGPRPGGWAFEFENDLYPDVDDSAVVCLALRELEVGEEAVQRGLAWIAGMQSEDGGWGAFDADNTSTWLYKLPFCDFGAVIDPPSEDVSAHALEALAGDSGVRERRAAGAPLPPRQPASRGLLVGAVGREPPLRHGGRAAGARGVRRAAWPSGLRARDCVARLRPGAGRRLRRGHPLVP